jgi:SAM-dependent methyltransferase
MDTAFYDRLAPDYHLLYPDWERAVARQGAALAAVLHAHGVASGDPVLDAACGIGTQTLGLIAQGFALTASDLSPGAVTRLQQELDARGLHATLRVDDLRRLSGTATGSQAAVLACDNCLPHLLSDAEILQSFRSAWRCLRPGGLLLISVRDYAAIPRVSPDVRPYGARRDAEGRRFLAVQVWEWDGDCYDLRLYRTVEHPDGRCDTEVLHSRYRAITLDRLAELMAEAGFEAIERRDDVLFQPVLLGRKPAAPA